jgi:hypothetical protein
VKQFKTPRVTTRLLRAVPAVIAVAAAACQQKDPTSVDASLLPEQPVTVEISFPWADFASNLQMYGGYGTAAQTGSGFIAKDYDDTLTARTLVRFDAYPTTAVVLDSLGDQLTDYDISFHGGRLVAFFDSVGSDATKPITLDLGIVRTGWDVRTADWTWAVDTVGNKLRWPEAGAGPVDEVTTTVWDPSRGDSAVFVLDSAQAMMFRDTSSTDSTLFVAARLSALTPGARLKLTDAALRLETHSSLVADTAFELSVGRSDLTFVYDPPPAAPTDGLRVGGTPGWRSVLDVAVPRTLNGPAQLCAVVQCPMKLTADQITYAALVLYPRPSEGAFAPTDSVYLDARPIFRRSALPKAPLGASLITNGVGRRLAPALFQGQAGATVEVPITEWVQALVGDTANTQPRSIALLSTYEPIDIAYASFHGPESPLLAPMLRLVVTVGPPVEHP